MSKIEDEDVRLRPATRRLQRLRGPLLACAMIVLSAVAVFSARQYWMSSGLAQPAAARESTQQIGGPFTLVDQDGKTVTDADFRGQWLLVYFGYTYCPDVCPTALSRNGDAVDLLGSKGEKVTPLLVTVDPQRDNPEKLKDFVHFFHPRTVGLTGTPEQIAAVAREYRVFYAKAPGGEASGYLMDHTSITYLIGPDGKFVQFFRHEASAQEVADRLKTLL